MKNSLNNLIFNTRFIDDTSINQNLEFGNQELNNLSKKITTLSGMPINEDLLPDLYTIIKNSVERLNIDLKNIQTYVYPSSEIQATCQQYSENDFIISLSSGIIDLLNEYELEFVIGHEIGHALFQHDKYPSVGSSNIEHELFRLSRASEISADRIGYIACSNSENVYSALMKISSGLNDKYINYDIAAFIKLAENLDKPMPINHLEMTHPPLVIRARALLWFSLSDIASNPFGSFKHYDKDKKELDKKIKNDLDTYVDHQLNNDIYLAKEDLKFWMFALAFVMDGKLSKGEQNLIKVHFSENMLEKLVNYLSGLSKKDTIKQLLQKVFKCITHLKSLSNSYTDELDANINILSEYTDTNILNEIKLRIYNE